MAVIEYKHHKFAGDHRGHIPGFVTDPENWYNPVNHSYIGWAKDNAEYYIPWSTLKVLSKEDFVQRCIQMSQTNPISRPADPANSIPGPNSYVQLTTESEIRSFAEQWYDDFVARNSAT